MFPNIEIQIYLVNNADKIRRAKQLINKLRPGTYQGNDDPSENQQVQERPAVWLFLLLSDEFWVLSDIFSCLIDGLRKIHL